MGVIRTTANDVYRGTLGIASPVSKRDVRALFGTVEDAITNAANGVVSYETQAELFADLAHAAGTEGRVWNDIDTTKNGVYSKSGISGAGDWGTEPIYGLPATQSDLADEADARESNDGVLSANISAESVARSAAIAALTASAATKTDLTALTATVSANATTLSSHTTELATHDANVSGIMQEMEARPGDFAARFMDSISANPQAQSATALSTAVLDGAGKALVAPGTRIVASRIMRAWEIGRSYRARIEVTRTVDPGDPLNAAVDFCVAWYDKNKVALTGLAASSLLYRFNDTGHSGELAVGSGTQRKAVDLAAFKPAGAVYWQEYVRTYDAGQTLALTVLTSYDVTDSGSIAADTLTQINAAAAAAQQSANSAASAATNRWIVTGTVDAEPGSPSAGQTILLSDIASAHANNIAVWGGSSWTYTAPAEGWRVYDTAASVWKSYDGTSWNAEIAAPVSGSLLKSASTADAPAATGDGFYYIVGSGTGWPSAAGTLVQDVIVSGTAQFVQRTPIEGQTYKARDTGAVYVYGPTGFAATHVSMAAAPNKEAARDAQTALGVELWLDFPLPAADNIAFTGALRVGCGGSLTPANGKTITCARVVGSGVGFKRANATDTGLVSITNQQGDIQLEWFYAPGVDAADKGPSLWFARDSIAINTGWMNIGDSAVVNTLKSWETYSGQKYLYKLVSGVKYRGCGTIKVGDNMLATAAGGPGVSPAYNNQEAIDGVEFEDLTFDFNGSNNLVTLSTTSTTARVGGANGATNCKFTNVLFKNSGGHHFIYLYNSVGGTYDNNHVLNCRFENCGAGLSGNVQGNFVGAYAINAAPTIVATGSGVYAVGQVVDLIPTPNARAITSAVYDGGTGLVTVTTTAAHGKTVGQTYVLGQAGFTPSYYNRNVLATPTGASTYTYAPGFDPGAVTVLGTWDDSGTLPKVCIAAIDGSGHPTALASDYYAGSWSSNPTGTFATSNETAPSTTGLTVAVTSWAQITATDFSAILMTGTNSSITNNVFKVGVAGQDWVATAIEIHNSGIRVQNNTITGFGNAMNIAATREGIIGAIITGNVITDCVKGITLWNSGRKLNFYTGTDTPSGNVLTFADTTGIAVGMVADGSDNVVGGVVMPLLIPAGAVVTGVTSTTVTLSLAVTGDVPNHSFVEFYTAQTLDSVNIDHNECTLREKFRVVGYGVGMGANTGGSKQITNLKIGAGNTFRQDSPSYLTYQQSNNGIWLSSIGSVYIGACALEGWTQEHIIIDITKGPSTTIHIDQPRMKEGAWTGVTASKRQVAVNGSTNFSCQKLIVHLNKINFTVPSTAPATAAAAKYGFELGAMAKIATMLLTYENSEGWTTAPISILATPASTDVWKIVGGAKEWDIRSAGVKASFGSRWIDTDTTNSAVIIFEALHAGQNNAAAVWRRSTCGSFTSAPAWTPTNGAWSKGDIAANDNITTAGDAVGWGRAASSWLKSGTYA